MDEGTKRSLKLSSVKYTPHWEKRGTGSDPSHRLQSEPFGKGQKTVKHGAPAMKLKLNRAYAQ